MWPPDAVVRSNCSSTFHVVVIERCNASVSATPARSTSAGAVVVVDGRAVELRHPPVATARATTAADAIGRPTLSPRRRPTPTASQAWWRPPWSHAPRHVGEAGVVIEEGEAHVPGGSVAVLRDDDLGHALVGGVGVVDLIPVQEHDDVGVLL